MGNSARWDEDVTVREIPATRLIAIGWLVFLLVLSGMIAWELRMRSLGLVAGDLDDSKAHWAVERRKIAAGEDDGVVIIGSSRILFDTDLDIWKEMTGRRPVQLAMPGTSPRPFLTDLADDPAFRGLLVVDVAPEGFFTEERVSPRFAGVLDYWKEQSPSQRFGHQAGLLLSRQLAFLDDRYSLISLIDQLDLPNRGEIVRPYLAAWKLSESYDDRQTWLWQPHRDGRRLRRPRDTGLDVRQTQAAGCGSAGQDLRTRRAGTSARSAPAAAKSSSCVLPRRASITRGRRRMLRGRRPGTGC